MDYAVDGRRQSLEMLANSNVRVDVLRGSPSSIVLVMKEEPKRYVRVVGPGSRGTLKYSCSPDVDCKYHAEGFEQTDQIGVITVALTNGDDKPIYYELHQHRKTLPKVKRNRRDVFYKMPIAEYIEMLPQAEGR